jgi:hypothetical protein
MLLVGLSPPSFVDGGQSQREGIGQPEYQSMPSLRGVAHDGWLCRFIIIKAARKSIILQLCSSCQGNRYGREKAGGTCRVSPPARQASRRVGPAQGWANLDQASKHLEVFRFRDLSPTPKP